MKKRIFSEIGAFAMDSNTLKEKVCQSIIRELLTTPNLDVQLIQKIKKRYAKKYPSVGILSNATILSHATPKEKEQLRPFLKTKRIRTLSGIAVVAVMVKPYPCPNRSCIYCPTFSEIPKSYTGHEPSTMRGMQNNYDPYLQVRTRLNQLEVIGHKKQWEFLKRSFQEKRLAHAYLFTGPESVGKKKTALEFAKLVLCRSQKSQPCNKCQDCYQVDNLIHPDFLLIKPSRSAAQKISIEEIRTLKEKISITSGGKYKIAVIDNAHRLTQEAQSALLKLLEEPQGLSLIHI